jgi:hypothetical protein
MLTVWLMIWWFVVPMFLTNPFAAANKYQVDLCNRYWWAGKEKAPTSLFKVLF